MTLQEFIDLSETEQMEFFWNGVFVGEVREGEFKIACHQVEDFYVEYKILGGHYLDMRLFRNPDFLDPYLDQMEAINLQWFYHKD